MRVLARAAPARRSGADDAVPLRPDEAGNLGRNGGTRMADGARQDVDASDMADEDFAGNGRAFRQHHAGRKRPDLGRHRAYDRQPGIGAEDLGGHHQGWTAAWQFPSERGGKVGSDQVPCGRYVRRRCHSDTLSRRTSGLAPTDVVEIALMPPPGEVHGRRYGQQPSFATVAPRPWRDCPPASARASAMAWVSSLGPSPPPRSQAVHGLGKPGQGDEPVSTPIGMTAIESA